MNVDRAGAADTNGEQLPAGNMALRYDKASDPQFTHGRDLIDLLALRPGDRILDIGCGTGRLAAFAVTQLAREGQIIGIDPAASRIKVAQRNPDRRLQFHPGNAEDLSSFASSGFDVAYMNSVLKWVKHRSLALAEAYRVLKVGGRFGIATTISDRQNEVWQLSRRARDVVLGFSAEEVAERAAEREAKGKPSAGEVRELLDASGFRTRVFDVRTYVSSFANVAQVHEFMLASTYEDVIPKHQLKRVEQVRAALERLIAELIPEARRRSGIQLERYVLLAVADKPQ